MSLLKKIQENYQAKSRALHAVLTADKSGTTLEEFKKTPDGEIFVQQYNADVSGHGKLVDYTGSILTALGFIVGHPIENYRIAHNYYVHSRLPGQ